MDVHRLDPWVAAQIDRALEPYVGRLAASDLAWMREQLAETLTADAAAARLVRDAKPRTVDESGEVGVEGDAKPGLARTKTSAG